MDPRDVIIHGIDRVNELPIRDVIIVEVPVNLSVFIPRHYSSTDSTPRELFKGDVVKGGRSGFGH